MENKILANIKSLAFDMLNETKSEDSNIVVAAAPVMFTLFAKHLNISLNDPTWINRDRFVLSDGHLSALLYSTLYFAGYNISIDDLKNYKHYNYKTPGYPVYNMTPGIDMSAGLPGCACATSVGMVLGRKILSSKYVIPKKNIFGIDSHIIDYKVYTLITDADAREGLIYEAASFASMNKLDGLVVLYISLQDNNVLSRFSGCGWNTISIRKGNDLKEIDKAIGKAKSSSSPTIIEFKCDGKEKLNNEGTILLSNLLNDNGVASFKALNNIPNEKFYVYDEYKRQFGIMISNHSSSKYSAWASLYKQYVDNNLSGDYSKFNYLFDKSETINLLKEEFKFETDTKESLFSINTTIMERIAHLIPNFIGGSNNMMHLDRELDITTSNYNGKNINFNCGENAIGCITNGLVLSKFMPFCVTDLIFTEYMRNSIRMASIMHLPSIFIFNNDVVNSTNNGPFVQPIEQILSLRTIPNLNVYRPCDAVELLGCWHNIINTKDKPSALILSNKESSLVQYSRADLVSIGAYIVFQPSNVINLIIVATGSDIHTGIRIANELWNTNHLSVRVVSMPCVQLYLNQDVNYQNDLLPKNIKTFTIEAGNKLGLSRFATNLEYAIGIDDYSISGTSNEILRYSKFDYESIKSQIMNKL